VAEGRATSSARRETTRRARVRAWLGRHPRIVSAFAIAALALLSLAVGLTLATWQYVCRDCPSIAEIYAWEPKQSTKILDREGNLIDELFQERRTPVDIQDLPPHVPQAFVAIEDKRFYRHGALDLRRLASVGVRTLVSASYHGGGSTITQQLARNMFEQQIGFERRGMAGITRKLKEARVSVELEEVYSKDQILEAYMNQVNYDHGWRGIETASQNYFGKPATQINQAEAALLAAIVNRPAHYNPLKNPEGARRRRNLVLSLMAAQGYLSETDAERWKQEGLPAERKGTVVGVNAPYFVEWVREVLDDRFGSRLYSGGLRVYTTLDLDMQRAARTAMDGGWERIEAAGPRAPKFAAVMADGGSSQSNASPYVQGAFVALDPATGAIRALIGGRDFGDSKFNRATQAQRQPGSTFKPFVYLAALESGIPASHVMYDAPLMLEMPDSTIYSPKNYDPEFRGPLTLRDALKHSVNTIAVKLGLDVGLETVAQTARRLGIRTDIPAYPSTAIGATVVVPLQIAEAYATIANTGMRVRPWAIARVTDAGGRVLWEPPRPSPEQVADSLASAIVRDMMRTVVDNGTGYNARNPQLGNLPYEVPAAGKTGTTNDNTNVWFIGFTPDLLAAVWFGFDLPRPIVAGATGGTYGAPVFGQFMRTLYYGDDKELDVPPAWPMPPGITTRRVDRLTGKLANEWCEANAYVEYYIPGTEPTEACEPAGLFGAPIRGFPALPPRDTTRTPPP
jgi:penicillin-binding protein 1A